MSTTRLSGGIGRHARLKIWCSVMGVWVRVPSELQNVAYELQENEC